MSKFISICLVIMIVAVCLYWLSIVHRMIFNLILMVSLVGGIIVGLSMAPAIPEIIGSLFKSKREEQFEDKPSLIVQKEKIVQKESVMITCNYCGSLMPQTAIYCPYCGAKRK